MWSKEEPPELIQAGLWGGIYSIGIGLFYLFVVYPWAKKMQEDREKANADKPKRKRRPKKKK